MKTIIYKCFKCEYTEDKIQLIRYITDDLKYFADERFHYLPNERMDIKNLYDVFFLYIYNTIIHS